MVTNITIKFIKHLSFATIKAVPNILKDTELFGREVERKRLGL